VGNLAQQGLGFAQGAQASVEQRRGGGRFVEDDPRQLFIGAERLDRFLIERGEELAVKLRALLEELDFSRLEAAYDRRGRRPISPRTMVGLIVYGMLNQRWSLRSLEGLARRDVGAWWVCGGQQPDHSTIGDFVQRHGEVLSGEFFVDVTRQLAKRMNLGPGVTAADGTVIEAAASRYGALRAEAAALAAQKAREEAARDPEDWRKQRCADAAKAVAEVARERTEKRIARHGARSGDAVAVAPSDPEAYVQPRKDGARRPAYKPSAMVHEQGLIVAQAVHPMSEMAVVGTLIDQHQEVLGATPATLLLDAGYHSGPLLRDLAEREINVLSPSGGVEAEGQWHRAPRKGEFAKERFRYDSESDSYACPAGQRLVFAGEGVDRGRPFRWYRTMECVQCALRPQCIGDRRQRRLKRFDAEEYREAMVAVLEQPAARAVYLRRAAIAERPLAELRERQGFRRLHRRGQAGARVEVSLHCLAFNLKWAAGRDEIALAIVAAVRDGAQGQLLALAILRFPA